MCTHTFIYTYKHTLLTSGLSSSIYDHLSLRGPEGGRSSSADSLEKIQPTQQFQHHRACPLHSLNDDRHFTCPQHQTHVAFSKTNDMVSSLRWAHLLTPTLVLVFFPFHIYMESAFVLWGVSVLLFEKDIKWDQRGA